MDVEVVVEIPKGTRNKYEADHETGHIWLDRMLFTSTRYPEDYGYVPGTLAGDGDPLDALVLLEEPTFPGCHVQARPIGVFLMSDENGDDAKFLCVTASDPRQAAVQDLDDLPAHELDEIAHFFAIYKALEPGQGHDTGRLAVAGGGRGDRRGGAGPLPGRARQKQALGPAPEVPGARPGGSDADQLRHDVEGLAHRAQLARVDVGQPDGKGIVERQGDLHHRQAVGIQVLGPAGLRRDLGRVYVEDLGHAALESRECLFSAHLFAFHRDRG